MNRLILIGNGFDLAHGMKTSYNDFVYWYIHGCFEKAHNSSKYEDSLIKIRRTQYYYFPDDKRRLKWIYMYLASISFPNSESDNPRRDFKQPPTSAYEVIFMSNILLRLLSEFNNGRWVDIESQYFHELKLILKMNNPASRQFNLTALNQSMSFIISQLENYLTNLPPAPLISAYEDIFLSEKSDRYLSGKSSDTLVTQVHTYVLNFNYTDTPKRYISTLTNSNFTINHIHGQLQNPAYKLIFGFGDEIDDAYKMMEDDVNVKGYFDYIKSFWYLRTENYRDLVNFLDTDDYEVHVLGHSCGLSDRTMLRMIFENVHCQSIKIYYHEWDGDDNFVSLTHEIARHFTDKGMMRMKIVSKEGTGRMPQHDD